MTDSQRARQGYAAGNLKCACMIALDPVAYPEGSLPALWSDLILSRAAQPDDALVGPLFESRAA